jgi:hypothetical protein
MHLVARLNYDRLILREVEKREGRGIRQSDLKNELVEKKKAMSERTFYNHLRSLSCGQECCEHEPQHPILHRWDDRSSVYASRQEDSTGNLIELFGAGETKHEWRQRRQ